MLSFNKTTWRGIEKRAARSYLLKTGLVRPDDSDSKVALAAKKEWPFLFRKDSGTYEILEIAGKYVDVLPEPPLIAASSVFCRVRRSRPKMKHPPRHADPLSPRH